MGLRGCIGGSGVIPFLPSVILSFCLSVLLAVFLVSFIFQRRQMIAGGELHYLAGLPGGGGQIIVLSYSDWSQYRMIKQQ